MVYKVLVEHLSGKGSEPLAISTADKQACTQGEWAAFLNCTQDILAK